MKREQILGDVLQILREKCRRLDPGFAQALDEQTRIVGDLDFESVMLVEFCMAIGKRFGRKLPFQELVLRDGQLQDFSVGQLVAFLDEHLAR